MKAFLYVLGIIFIWPVQLLFFKRKTYYIDKKAQSRRIKGGAILISNHKSFKDFMMYLCAFPFRKIYCLMSEKVYGINKMVSYLSTVLGGIRVDRTNYDFSFIGKSVELLDKNKLLMVFPEGKMPTNKNMQKFYPSYILIALKSGKPIIPIYTNGVYHFFKRSRMVVGKPIYLNEYCKTDNPSKEEIEYLNKICRDKVLELERYCHKMILREKYHKTFKISKLFTDLGRLIAVIMGKTSHKYKAHGNLAALKNKENYIIAANHVGYKDPIYIYNLCKRRRLRMLVAEVVFDGHKIRGRALKSLGCIRVDRKANDMKALSISTDILNGGGVLAIFPEGQICREGIGEIKPGTAYLAYKTNSPILPVYIKNGKKKGHLYIGDYINVDSNLKAKEAIAILDDKIMNSWLKLKDVADKENL